MELNAERVNAEIDRLIAGRSKETQAANDRAKIEREAVERHQARRSAANKWEWAAYFDRMVANHAALAEGYRQRADALAGENRG